MMCKLFFLVSISGWCLWASAQTKPGQFGAIRASVPPGNISASSSRLVTDTLWEPATGNMLEGSGQMTVYQNLSPAPFNGGYVCGTNGYGDREKAQRFHYPAAGQVTGALALFGAKWIVGAADSIQARLYTVSATDTLPDSLLTVSSSVCVCDIDTSGNVYTYFSFSPPVNLGSDFYISVAVDGPAMDDTVALFSNTDGDGYRENLAAERLSDTTWNFFCCDTSTWILQTDLFLFPVVSGSVLDVSAIDCLSPGDSSLMTVSEGNNTVSVILRAQSYSSVNVKSYEIGYRLGGGTTVTQAVNASTPGGRLGPGLSELQVFSVPLTIPLSDDTLPLRVWASRPGGGTDAFLPNDTFTVTLFIDRVMGMEEAAGWPGFRLISGRVTEGRLGLWFAMKEPVGMRLALYSLAGEHILSARHAAVPGNNHLALDVPNLAGGLYLLRLSSQEKTATMKVWAGP